MIRRSFRPYGGDSGLIPPKPAIAAWWDRITRLEVEPEQGRRGPVWEGRNGKEPS